MPTYSVCKSFQWRGRVSDKVARVCRMFGLTVEVLGERIVTHECRVEINDGDIVYITGPSGAGKSVLLRELQNAVPAEERIDLGEVELPGDRTLIDCIEGGVLGGLRTLSIAGLNDVFCILNQPANLSKGQKYRFRLAMALAARKKFIFADEFCSELDRVTAAVVSYNIHRFAKRTGTAFVLASSHDDILLDLAPDVVVVKELSGPAQVIYRESS